MCVWTSSQGIATQKNSSWAPLFSTDLLPPRDGHCFLLSLSFVIRWRTTGQMGFSFCFILCLESLTLWPVRIFSLVSSSRKMREPAEQAVNPRSSIPFLSCASSQGSLSKRSWFVRSLCHLKLHCHVSTGEVPVQWCPPSVTDEGSVTGGISHSQGKLEVLFLLNHSSCLWQ